MANAYYVTVTATIRQRIVALDNREAAYFAKQKIRDALTSISLSRPIDLDTTAVDYIEEWGPRSAEAVP